MIIYKATCLINDKVYVGITSKTLDYRIKLHRKNCASKSQKNYDCKFYRAARKYGWDNFQFREIERVESYKELLDKESSYVEIYNSYKKGYNSTLGGDINPSKCKEIAAKISKALKGRTSPLKGRVLGPCKNKQKPKTIEHALKISKAKGGGEITCSKGKRYPSIRQAARDLGIHHSRIVRSIKKNKPMSDGTQFYKQKRINK